MKFPYSISSLHYRRCDLGEATHVAIAVVDGHVKDTENTFDDTYIHNIRKFFSSFFWFVNEVMTFVFSERNFFGCERSGSGYYRVIPVTTDPNDGTRYIMFRFRRYNLADGKFVPGVVNQVQTIGDVIQANTASGLSDTQIQATRSLIGDNTISMPKPTFLRCLKHETSKPFYTYQTFMVWTWFPVSMVVVLAQNLHDTVHLTGVFSIKLAMVLLHGYNLVDLDYHRCSSCELFPIPK
jgi:hypothetical protein